MFWDASLTVADESSLCRPTCRFALGKQRHRRRGERREPDPDPRHAGLVATQNVAPRREHDVGGEDEVTRGDELLRVSLGRVRVQARTREQPHDHEARESLDQAVRAEPDQRDRTGGQPGADRDGELDQVPAVPNPRKEPRPSLPERAARQDASRPSRPSGRIWSG